MDRIVGAKAVTWDWGEIQSLSSQESLYVLTEQDISVLLTATVNQARWSTRWFNRPSNFQDITEFVDLLSERLMSPQDFCQLMVDCIENNQSVKDALQVYLNDELNIGNNNSDNPILGGGGDGNLLDGLPCDLDSIYGVAVAIEDYVFSTARDVWEVIIDNAVDSVAKARLIDYLPLLGDLPVLDDINDLITQIRVFGLNAFDIGYNTQIRQDNICGIFALACDDCEMLASDVALFYAQGALPNYDITAQFWAMIKILVDGTFTEIQIVRAWMAIVASTLVAGGGVLGRVGIEGFKDIAKTGNPDGDWQVFCDPCGGAWCYLWDFTTDSRWALMGGGGVFPPEGVYTASTGWQTTTNGTNPPSRILSVVSTTEVLVSGLEVEIEINFDVSQIGQGTVIIVENRTTQELLHASAFGTGQQQKIIMVTPNSDGVLGIRIRPATNGTSGQATLTSVRYSGDENKPNTLENGADC